MLRWLVPHSIQCTFGLVAMAFHRVINTHQLHWKIARLLVDFDLPFARRAVALADMDCAVLEQWLVNTYTMNAAMMMMGLMVLPMFDE